jgi:hypothetical protein
MEKWQSILVQASDLIKEHGKTNGYFFRTGQGYCALGAISKVAYDEPDLYHVHSDPDPDVTLAVINLTKYIMSTDPRTVQQPGERWPKIQGMNPDFYSSCAIDAVNSGVGGWSNDSTKEVVIEVMRKAAEYIEPPAVSEAIH